KNFRFPEDVELKDRLFVRFHVEVDGRISDPVILKGLHPSLDAEALRVVGLMPHWIPASINGRPCRSRCVLPFSFDHHVR
ncbi:MAG TPA: energy transducer TonB, partial [Flavobacteriales bacterium]